MKWRIPLLLVVLAGVAFWSGLFGPALAKLQSWTVSTASALPLPQSLQSLPAAMQPAPTVLYRWKDAKGQFTYGTQPPPNAKAELVADKGMMSSVPATKIPEPPKKELPPGVTIQQLATERAIEQATGAK
ncbi:hypothetical protein GCM10027046_23260 [Uliginosibacterium flavum]|uniref:DUF4124 domain-containing protein n=1 Tax=Uliginosibacterium flavum TaxID=1396831 RepID=A0ABV2TRV1_9RHOO